MTRKLDEHYSVRALRDLYKACTPEKAASLDTIEEYKRLYGTLQFDLALLEMVVTHNETRERDVELFTELLEQRNEDLTNAHKLVEKIKRMADDWRWEMGR